MFPLKTTERCNTWPVMTWVLILLNLFAYYQMFMAMQQGQGALDIFIGKYALFPNQYDLAHPSRIALTTATLTPLVTHMFVHGGLVHILGNLLSLMVFGPNVEDRFGHIGFVVVYFACGLFAALTHIFFNLGSIIPVVGASGAIAGVMGAFFVMFPKARVVSVVPIVVVPVILRIPAVVYLFFWIGMNVINALKDMRFGGSGDSGVAWWAHIGGFAIGMIYASVLSKQAPPGKPQND
jgi:membrane associated rhomboid family serine protease